MGNRGFFGFGSSEIITETIERFGLDISAGSTCTSNVSYYGSRSPEKCIDDSYVNDDACWLTNGTVTNVTWKIQLASAACIKRFTIRNGAIQVANRGVKQMRIEASNDGTNFTKLPIVKWENGPIVYNVDEIQLANNQGTTLQVLEVYNKGVWSYYQFYCYNNWGDGSYLGMAEVELLPSVSGG